MAGQRCCKNERQVKIIELLKRYRKLLITSKKAIFSGQLDVAQENMRSMELLLTELQASVKNGPNEVLIADIQFLLLEIKELQQQICDHNSHQLKKLKTKKPNNVIKKYYYKY